MKNREEYRYEKTDSYDMQIRLMECVCKLGIGGRDSGEVLDDFIERDDAEKSVNPFGKDVLRSTNRPENDRHLSISLSHDSIFALFDEFSSHLINRLAPHTLIPYYKNHLLCQYRLGMNEKPLL